MSQENHGLSGNKNALIGLFLGLGSFVLLMPVVGLITALVSVFFAYKGYKGEKKLLSVVALIISSLGLLFMILWNTLLFFGSFT